MIGKNMACVAFEVWLVEEEAVGWQVKGYD